MIQATSIIDLVVERCEAAPVAVAVAGPDNALTYGALRQRADGLAQTLAALGAGPERLVALALPRSSDLVVAATATFLTGAAYVPLDPGWPPERLGTVLADAQPVVVVADERQGRRLPHAGWTLVTLDRALPPPLTARPMPRSPTGPDELAYVIYTSGSTGRPKGVELTHAGLLNLVLWHNETFALTPSDRVPLMASPGFDASVWELWPALAAGASLHVPDEAVRGDAEALRDWLIQSGVTVAFVPTPVAERLLTVTWPARVPLRLLLTGAETLHRRPPAGLPFTVVNNYGPTECTVVATSDVVEPEGAADGLPAIGRPIRETRAWVLDGDGRPVPPGGEGELYIGGPGVGRGYRNLPAVTAGRFVPDPFGGAGRLYRTGDQVRRAPDGRLLFLGRLDDQVKIRGHRVELDEIVAALDAHPGVLGSAVTAPPGADGERRLIAYVVARPGASLTPAALRATLQSQLPASMIPAVFIQLDALPLTASGKVDRARLPAPEAAAPLTDPAALAPRTRVEAELTAMVAGLLGVPAVGVTDNFFLLGGHSLLGTQLIVRLREAFGTDLSLRTLFDHPTVAELAAEVEGRVRCREAA